MESNLTSYTNLTPAATVDSKTLNKMVWRSCFLQASFNYERMQSGGWLYAMLPGLQKVHTDKEDLAKSMMHNLDFINTHPFLVTFVMGIVLSMEQQKADIASIRAVRISAAAPLGGIGDALVWFTFQPIIASISASLAVDGSILGAIFYFAAFNIAQFALRWWLLKWSYGLGTSAISVLTANAREFTHAASLLGVFIVGVLTYNMGAGSAKIRIVIESLGNTGNIQAVVDGILPGILGLGFVLLIYVLLKKYNFTAMKCIFMLLAIGLVGTAFGIWEGSAGMVVDTDNNGAPDAGLPGGYTPLVEWYTLPAAE